jgi:predicted transcriptional regulator
MHSDKVPSMNTEKPSRLELYIEILRSIEKLHSSNIITIQEKTNVEQAFLAHAMNFLESQNLVRQERVDNQVVYMTTPRGDRVTKYFINKSQAIPVNDDPMARIA